MIVVEANGWRTELVELIDDLAEIRTAGRVSCCWYLVTLIGCLTCGEGFGQTLPPL